ncbi:hypothetical protein [Phytohabitans houttuyneae]|uniref:hypothetical protein n=1 Tax=Phytohabitans houttuyneae TaxID=1076126 RepID=UPI001563F453|nr:hypothetical protein [Phytohabitans houttuyneae]
MLDIDGSSVRAPRDETLLWRRDDPVSGRWPAYNSSASALGTPSANEVRKTLRLR